MSCTQEQDSRFFAPEIAFVQGNYSVTSDAGGLDLGIALSRPAPVAMTVDFNTKSSLQEDVQFKLNTHSLSLKEGDSTASIHVSLMDDEIWDKESWIEIILSPGTRYTLNPDNFCVARIDISKDVQLPQLSLVVSSELEINPYLPETFNCVLESSIKPTTNIDVQLEFGDLVCGKDYLINGGTSPVVVFPAGTDWIPFKVSILHKDISGLDKHAVLSIVPQKGVYVPAEGESSVDVHLYDPVVDFSRLLRTAAQMGEGHQLRQAIKTAAGGWDGNLAANVTVTSEGSNYLKSLKNLDTVNYGCPSVAVGLHILRLPDFFPTLRTTSGDAILDYGNNNNTRGFSAVDSLFRFVLDKGSATQGTLALARPRTFTAVVGDYTAWKDIWKADANSTGGNVLASVNPVITGRVNVTLERLEGRFDLSSSSETMLFTVWLSSDSPAFMEGVNLETIGAVREDNGSWRVEYKLWPR